MPRTLILVRHGEAEGSAPGVLCGRSDPGLSEEGRRQAAQLQPVVAGLSGARFLCSPLARARQTADLALRGTHVFAEADGGLQEMDFGQWEGLTYQQAAEQWPDLAAGWAEWRPDFGFPGGETLAGFAARMAAVARRLAFPDPGDHAADRTVVAFTHGGVARSLMCFFLGLPLQNYLLFDVAPGSVAVLRLWEMRGVLSALGPVDGLTGLIPKVGPA